MRRSWPPGWVVGVIATGLYNQEALDLAIAGHSASDMCFSTGLMDPGCA